MAIEIRRVVTGRDAKNKSVFTSSGPAEVVDLGGLGVMNLWGTGDGGAQVDSDPAERPEFFPFFPPSSGHGTRLVAVHFAPEAAGGGDEPSPGEAAAAAEEMERLQPGLASAFEPDAPGMHTTDTVDYGICVRGEVWLELDDGAEERITPGTVVVQRGTRHAWRNRSSEPATVVYVLVGARRD
ncbi:cupin domain-containing protein [Pseudonocardia sp. WMMC193]|uniref:cupin domain-containing protein n=1 Tax=Pseudonocardia sp. WMMC193 TaxID=2911965 RepID=UPI001F3C9F45|nr:cupin domain-containing protein [Pseudonocardia sp. WMMC193]MCF7550770.1 cupin domain-containing protein [Pseudonocardia sp. WMMC193]